MKVVVERSGGFAGVKQRGECVERDLTPAQQEALNGIVERSGASLTEEVGSDRFAFKIELHDGNSVKTFTVPESSMPRILADIATK
jgi:hypothetical protein